MEQGIITMEISFTKSVPDELYIDSFGQNKTVTITYNGPEILKVLVDIISGGIQYVALEPSENIVHNPDFSTVLTVDANISPDVAYYIKLAEIPGEQEFITENLPGGKTYQKLVNPTLRDYYALNYNFETNAWNWTLITRQARSMLNDLADKYKDYINTHKSKVENNQTLTDLANTYLAQLEAFNTTGIGSIPSWKFIEFSLAEVPAPPLQLVTAFNVLP